MHFDVSDPYCELINSGDNLTPYFKGSRKSNFKSGFVNTLGLFENDCYFH